MIDPLKLIQSAKAWHSDDKKIVFMGFRASYDRGNELTDTVNKVLDIFDMVVAHPVANKFSQMSLMRDLCAHWAGADNQDKLFDILYDFHHALKNKSLAAKSFRPLQMAGSCRHLTRPLVFDPSLLSEAEESSFLPYIFNNFIEEARQDYIDQHGGRISGPAGDGFSSPQFNGILNTLQGCAKRMEALHAQGGGDKEWLGKLATSIRIYYHLMRSINNFYYGQKVRDHHADVFDRENYVPNKGSSFNGEGLILRWKDLQRDEYDNIAALIKLFEERGLDQFSFAVDAKDQDSMSFPPHVVDDLKKKLVIMRDHWLDVEKYLAPPMK
ncbi:MAG: hypothetical protein HRU15_19445 [Planctomycetes bacterium]|nr:hypothetical protein [Planctomycetota bacterium]